MAAALGSARHFPLANFATSGFRDLNSIRNSLLGQPVEKSFIFIQ